MYPALNRSSLGQGSFEEFIDAAAAAGFPAVDTGIDPLVEVAAKQGPAAAAEVLAKRKLRLAVIGVSAPWQGDQAKFDAALPAFARQVEVAARLGVDRAVTWVPSWADVPYDERLAQVLPKLRKVYEILDGAGLLFGVEFLGPKTLRKGPHDFVHTMEQGLGLADAIGPHCGLLLDSFHWFTAGGTAETLAKVPVDLIVHVHVNDAPNRPRDEQIDGERLLPGEGIIDLKGFFGALKRNGYRGPVGVEVFNKELKALSMMEAAKKAKAAIDRVLSAV